MNKIPAILVNYNYDPGVWLKDYPELEPIIYDRSDDGVERNLPQYGLTIKTENKGDVDFDKLGWLVENYDNLPDVFVWGKTNLFKFVDELTFKEALRKKEFTPLIRPDHRIYSDHLGQVNMYRGQWYMERADSWFFNATNPRYFFNWEDWCAHFNLPRDAYIPFAPGACYILTRERVHRYSRDIYEDMRSFLPHCQRPAEAQACERTYGYLWR